MVHAQYPDRSRQRSESGAGDNHDPVPDPDDVPKLESDDGVADEADDDETASTPTRAIDRFRTGALGSVTAAALLGLRDALEGRREERPAIERPAQAPLEDDQPFELHLEPGAPEQSYVVFRKPTAPPDN